MEDILKCFLLLLFIIIPYFLTKQKFLYPSNIKSLPPSLAPLSESKKKHFTAFDCFQTKHLFNILISFLDYRDISEMKQLNKLVFKNYDLLLKDSYFLQYSKEKMILESKFGKPLSFKSIVWFTNTNTFFKKREFLRKKFNFFQVFDLTGNANALHFLSLEVKDVLRIPQYTRIPKYENEIRGLLLKNGQFFLFERKFRFGEFFPVSFTVEKEKRPGDTEFQDFPKFLRNLKTNRTFKIIKFKIDAVYKYRNIKLIEGFLFTLYYEDDCIWKCSYWSNAAEEIDWSKPVLY